MPFRIALSGLDAASTDLQVTGNNIANAATTGFKQSRAEFADIYANSIQDVSTTSAGRGVRVSRVAQQFSQGNVDFTSNSLDLALNGEGFFTLQDTAGNTSYTRAGAFTVDRDGYVVNSNNDRLQVFAPIGTTGNFNTGATGDLQLPTLSGAPSATTSADVAVNLDSSGTAMPAATLFDPTIATSYDNSTSTTVYDSLGTAHTMTMYFRKSDAAANQWHVYTTIDGNVVTPTTNSTAAPSSATYPSATVDFDTAGALVTGSGSISATGTLDFDPYAIAGADPLDLTFDMNNSTQFGSEFAVNNLTQDGYATGRLSGVDVDSTGVVSATFTNGQSTALGKVALAKFNNPQGLRQIGDTNWAETYTSGDVQMGAAGTSSFGLVQSGGLENSNVDIAEQLVNLITAQRNYQANAQVITTADTVTQTIINIR